MLMSFLEQASGRCTWSLWVTWCPRAPCWWPLHYWINLRSFVNLECQDPCKAPPIEDLLATVLLST